MSALKNLSDKELLAETLKLRHREHETTLEILSHLNEIERRRLHLKLGYSSLFEYCARHLKYSASAACRRIQTARCVRRYPEVYEFLEQEKVNLSTVSLVAPILTDKNKREILDAICGKSQREVEEIASRYRPPVALRDMVKPVRVHVSDRTGSAIGLPLEHSGSRAEVTLDHPMVGSKTSSELPATSGQSNSAMSNHHRSGGQELSTRSRSGSNSSNEPEAQIQQKLLIQFLADEEFMRKYEAACSLLSQRLSDTSFAAVFDALISEFLEHHSPIRKKARRDMKKQQQERRIEKQIETTQVKRQQPAERNRRMPQDPSRHIPAAIRDEVFIRDNSCCTYVGRTGERCGSTHALQIDHIVPFARGGATTASNLRLLCAKHNRLAAEEVFGEPFTRQFRAREVQPHQQE